MTDVLISCKFTGDEQRIEAVLELLKQQDIDEVHELAHFPLAHTLVVANLLLAEELATEQTISQSIKRVRELY